VSFELLARHFVEKPWGQSGLPEAFGGRDEKIGEIWFDRAGEKLPLLVKWLFTSEKLSVQVHPDDTAARARGVPAGKDECWIVVEAGDDARLGIGLTQDLTPSELREASLSGEIADLLDWKPVRAGDWFYIPPGTIHAIGAGVRLVEVQPNSDITYRLYDYGRPRELHLDDGIAVCNASSYDAANGTLPRAAGLHDLLSEKYFKLSCAIGAQDLSRYAGRECYLVPTAGEYRCGSQELAPGMVALGDPSSLTGAGSDHVLLIAERT
jgi:mannose-6-phosphate isomerase